MKVDAGALREVHVELALLFGSRARGTARPDSDVDVGVLLAPDAPIDVTAERVREAFGDDDEIQVALLNRADPLLLREVALDGKVLFEAHPGAVEEFRIRAFTMYMDTEWLRRAEADALRRRYG